jgi:hypothetical protein
MSITTPCDTPSGIVKGDRDRILGGKTSTTCSRTHARQRLPFQFQSAADFRTTTQPIRRYLCTCDEQARPCSAAMMLVEAAGLGSVDSNKAIEGGGWGSSRESQPLRVMAACRHVPPLLPGSFPESGTDRPQLPPVHQGEMSLSTASLTGRPHLSWRQQQRMIVLASPIN